MARIRAFVVVCYVNVIADRNLDVYTLLGSRRVFFNRVLEKLAFMAGVELLLSVADR